MMTALRLTCRAARLLGRICALMGEVVYFCFGYRMAAPQQGGISFTSAMRKQQPPRMAGKLRCNGLAKSGRYGRLPARHDVLCRLFEIDAR